MLLFLRYVGKVIRDRICHHHLKTWCFVLVFVAFICGKRLPDLDNATAKEVQCTDYNLDPQINIIILFLSYEAKITIIIIIAHRERTRTTLGRVLITSLIFSDFSD